MPQVLSPDDLRLAAEAYDKALGSLPPETFELQPYAVRRMVAVSIMDAVLSGVHDVARLHDEALASVSSTVAIGTAHRVGHPGWMSRNQAEARPDTPDQAGVGRSRRGSGLASTNPARASRASSRISGVGS
jgi:hypothetical protein